MHTPYHTFHTLFINVPTHKGFTNHDFVFHSEEMIQIPQTKDLLREHKEKFLNFETELNHN
jgi:hypothetical protein